MNVYVQDYLYWKIIPMAVICIVIPFLLVVFFATIGKPLQIKRQNKIFPKYMKVYGTKFLYIVGAIFTCFSLFAIFLPGLFFIVIMQNKILINAISDGINVESKEFLAQYHLTFKFQQYIFISFGISMLVTIILKSINFFYVQFKIKKFITKEYLMNWKENIENVKILNESKKIHSHYFREIALYIEKKLLVRINVLKIKIETGTGNFYEIHEVLCEYLLRLEKLLIFYNLKKTKQILDYYYTKAIKLLNLN